MTVGLDPVRTVSSRRTVDAVRARPPDRSGYAVRDGVRLYWEQSGRSGPAIFLLPPWSIVHSRCWKLQVPHLARHFRVITADPRGNGRSDRPAGPEHYADRVLMDDAVAVLDAAGIDAAVLVGLSMGARIALQLADARPDRVRGLALLGPSVRTTAPPPACWVQPFEQVPDSDEGWNRFTADYWRRDLPGFARFFFGEVFPEPHSSKQIDDAGEWAAQTDAETMIATQRAPFLGDGLRPEEVSALELADRLRCPSLVIHGDDDRIVPIATGRQLAVALGGRLEVISGGGHCVQARHPVRVNLLLQHFAESVG
ncbi:MAG TPA: alpha/beta hydrolase [Jatrophihabitans sp.]|uniref:alpha/beta fold hydrolase n=1 Tax=Jatrophihabitans sp. TaxID=1932789 RepID=UPI002E0BEB99|nr:alpha/beta hydrolase [Jatrophihabitans sp.]